MKESHEHFSFGVALVGQTRKMSNGHLYYRIPAAYESKTQALSRRFGIGIQFILPRRNECPNQIIGVLAPGSGGDFNGQMIGFLKSICREFGQGAALYLREPFASWQLLNIKTETRRNQMSEIGHFRMDRLNTLVSILLRHQSQTSNDEVAECYATLEFNFAKLACEESGKRGVLLLGYEIYADKTVLVH